MRNAVVRVLRWVGVVAMGGLFVGGGCLPDNFFVDKVGEIANALIIAGINIALQPTGITI